MNGGLRWTEEQLKALLARPDLVADRRRITPERVKEIAKLGGKARANKYRNVVTHVDGIKFDSKKEAQRYQQLAMMKAQGLIKGFARQVSIPLPSGRRRMRIDFVVHELDDQIRWEDVKGAKPTEAWQVRRAEVEAMLGITIETV